MLGLLVVASGLGRVGEGFGSTIGISECGLAVWSWCVRGGNGVYGRRLLVVVKKKENLRRLIGAVVGHEGGKSSGVVLENGKGSCVIRWRFSQ
ncbi:hypothetical protein D5086_030514 [Populus alba]|uniref:Uncharacterized protein n=1 Tax=Populus alba TaxID=43335 RepID=A0ACC4ANS6_POPAL